MKMALIPIVISALGTVRKVLLKGVEDLEITQLVEDLEIQHFKIFQNTEKSPGELRGLAVTQISVRNH